VRPIGFRTRLTLGHAAAVAVILAVTAVVADWGLARMVQGQIDAALITLAETEAASALDSREGGEIRVHLHPGAPEGGGPSLRRVDKLVQVTDAAGRPLARSASLGDAALPAPAALLERLRRGEVVVETVPDLGGEPVRLVSLPIEVDGRLRFALQVATSLRPARAFVATARLLFAAMSLAILVGVVAIGAVQATRALRPIDRIVDRARRIGESATLSERLPHPGSADEIGRLVATLNAMLQRIERAFEAQRHFTADASHELRSPLSRLRAELEVTLRRPRTAEEYEAALASCLEEVERLARLTEDLLTLARLDAGEDRQRPSRPTPLEKVIEEAVERIGPRAEERKVRLVHAPGERLAVDVPRGLLVLVVANLLDNAVKFSPEGGEVTAAARRDGLQAVLSVSDAGPGVAPADATRIFDRFYRGRSAGSPDAPGVGLGLAIVKTVVEAHRGSVAVESADGRGAVFTVRLPLAA
jgi:two-component system OmpR family sensor kinase